MDEIVLRLELSDAAFAPDRLEESVAPLTEDLRQLGTLLPPVPGSADGAEAGTRAEPGAKGDPATTGEIVLALIASPALAALLGVVKDWLGGSRHRSVKVSSPAGTLEVDRASWEQQQALIEHWIEASQRAERGDPPAARGLEPGAGGGDGGEAA